MTKIDLRFSVFDADIFADAILASAEPAIVTFVNNDWR